MYDPPGLSNSHATSWPSLASLAHFEALDAFCSSQKWPSSSMKDRSPRMSQVLAPRLHVIQFWHSMGSTKCALTLWIGTFCYEYRPRSAGVT